MINDKIYDPFSLLKQIIAIPSISGEEFLLSKFLQDWLETRGFQVNRKHNNIWIESVLDEQLPSILLNSHMDTVKPVKGWTRDPFLPDDTGNRIYGLGCSDAGASLVALIITFLELSGIKDRAYNLKLLISAEEESSGKKGITSVINEMGKIDLAIVGEPTNLEMAVCERGLIVIDCVSKGRAGHVAHREGENAIYKAMDDIQIIPELKFDKVSEFLGEVQVEVTQIEAGYQHNVIPDSCSFVLDVRTNEHYSNEEIVQILDAKLKADIKPRSLRLRSSFINLDHPLVKKAKEMEIHTFGSKTMSDQALIPAPSVKLGPGRSELSHKADEYIEKVEIDKGINLYLNFLKEFKM